MRVASMLVLKRCKLCRGLAVIDCMTRFSVEKGCRSMTSCTRIGGSSATIAVVSFKLLQALEDLVVS